MKAITILLIVIVFLLVASVYQLSNIKTMEQISTFWGANVPGIVNTSSEDTDLSISLRVPTFQQEPLNQGSTEETLNGIVKIAETFLRLGEAVDKSCQQKVLDQEQLLDKRIGNVRDFIGKSDRLSAEIEIELIRWQNICGDSIAEYNHVNSEKYGNIRKVLTASLQK